MAVSDPQVNRYFPLSIQISSGAWSELALNPRATLESTAAPLFRVRQVALALQQKHPAKPVRAVELNLLAILNRSLRYIAVHYLDVRGCTVDLDQATIADKQVTLPSLRPVQENFVGLFPPAELWRGKQSEEFLAGKNGRRNRRDTIVELFLLAIQNGNRAVAPFRPLFDDTELHQRCRYRQALAVLDRHLEQEEIPGLFGGSLLELLEAPIKASPDSLAGQLGYIQQQWGTILPEDLLEQLVLGFDILAEENMQRGFGGGPPQVPDFSHGFAEHEPQAFSPDTDWMPKVVLIAKTIYVWLDQLSKRYDRPIHRLDAIPDEELDRLAGWGFNSLWLIGLWERSSASLKIKRICGNPEAEASAYSLYDYTIAADLGGEEALARLEERCTRRGIRLASDVVPNHTGLDSRWMREHPDWFIQADHPPYPAYRFSGPDLADDGAVTVQIEDGYYDNSDAAVVFRHQDHHSGRVRYIYHGNDGTHMPWNDTAQLNYLIPEVREAMIGTIVGIARRFRVIRFDAAMTLAKKHFQRLWFPLPGDGGGVPSRAEYSMTKGDFDRVFPVEFWREVVDRVADEVPDTLLIAEAFWLMEGYFVRTLGMHRVYNSAFMNMLKLEENAKYRKVIRNILEFEPGILQRYTNFMNNPDEETAVEQFGKADKYFGVAILLATMPGLPMFGHGQIEGLKEKYGMEYRRAYWDEEVDQAFVHHHENQIFPLLQKRYLFSGAEQFNLYDFWCGDFVNDDVFAYSNGVGEQRALVVFNNRNACTAGRIHYSTERLTGSGDGLEATSLGLGLAVRSGERWYVRFRDHRSGLEYLRTGTELIGEGIYLELGPYEYHVFLDFCSVYDEDGAWNELYRRIGHAPVKNLDRELRKIRFRPIADAFLALVEPESLDALIPLLTSPAKARRQSPEYLAFSERLTRFAETLSHFAQPAGPTTDLVESILRQLEDLAPLAALRSRRKIERQALDHLKPLLNPAGTGPLAQVLVPYIICHRLAGPYQGTEITRRSAFWFDEFLLGDALQVAFARQDDAQPHQLAGCLIRHQEYWLPGRHRQDVSGLFADPETHGYLLVNWHEGTRWFNKERWESLLDGLLVAAALAAIETFRDSPQQLLTHLGLSFERLQTARRRALLAGYKVDALLELYRKAAPLTPGRKKARADQKLNILMVSSEVTPFAKSGGLADVAGSLPRALHALGHDVRIILPYYRTITGRGETLQMQVATATVAVDGQPRQAVLHQGQLDGVPVYFVDHPDFFDRDELYGSVEGDYWDNAQRFGFFCRAVLELMPKIGFCPDAMHLNDWQTGPLPALLRSEYRDDPFYAGTGTLMTIHNLGYQGHFPLHLQRALDLDPALLDPNGLEYHGNMSFLKGGLLFADLLSTVSETYCREIQEPQMGIGFDGILRARSVDLYGILNGLDARQWNPALDPALPCNFSADSLDKKAACKEALQRELGLHIAPHTPVVAMITRLATQKGLDMVQAAWDEMMHRDIQFVLLGTGEKHYMDWFAALQERYPGKVSINLSFDDDLSRRIYAGSDMFLMPSHYEPCGLGQLIALRYGVIPIARRTGGLADTISDPWDDPLQPNGFLFSDTSAEALLHTLDRALGQFGDLAQWSKMVHHGMTQDFTWTRSAEKYLELYRKAMEKRYEQREG